MEDAIIECAASHACTVLKQASALQRRITVAMVDGYGRDS